MKKSGGHFSLFLLFAFSNSMSDTIAALATPNGRSGIGVIRLSGPDSASIAERLAGTHEGKLLPRSPQLVRLHSAVNEVIDVALITYFAQPRSFTGENVVEISCHGSPVVLRQVIDLCLGMGARLAEPGEFSLRALANGRIDLTEAEAIRDLIDAQTSASARQAVRQLDGEFSHRLQPIKDALLDVIVVLESALEFVEDDLPENQTESVELRLSGLADSVGRIAATFEAGHLIREGLRVAVVGRPNVGKSSLFNALIGSERAIVTDIAGTTRDQIHERFTVEDIPVSLIDTAGLRETSDTVERIGVERSRRTIADADLVVVVLDALEVFTNEDRRIFDSVRELRHVVAINKIDLLTSEVRKANIAAAREEVGLSASLSAISAKTGEGIDAFKSAMIEPFSRADSSDTGFLVTDARHRDLLVRAQSDINESLHLFGQNTSEEIVLIGLHNALRYLGEITGETTTEDMLTRIFSTFCIGK